MANSPFLGKAIKYGTVMGALLIIIDLTLYIIGTSAFLSSGNFFLHFFAVPLAMVLVLVSLKRSFFGPIPYWMAFASAFLCFLICISLKAVFSFIMYNVVDTSLNPLLYDRASDAIIELMEILHFSPARIEQFVDNSRANTLLWSPYNSIRNIAFFSIPGLAIALFLGAIFRRKRRGSYFR